MGTCLLALANLIADLADLGSLGLFRPYFIRGPNDLKKSKNDCFSDELTKFFGVLVQF